MSSGPPDASAIGISVSEGAQHTSEGRFCTQQMLINNLLRVLIDEMVGDVRFVVRDVSIRNEKGERPMVSYTDASDTHTHTHTCHHIAGCDADRGVSRPSIPDGVLTTFTHDFGYTCWPRWWRRR